MRRCREEEGRAARMEGRAVGCEHALQEADAEVAGLKARLAKSEAETWALWLRVTCLEERLGRAAGTVGPPIVERVLFSLPAAVTKRAPAAAVFLPPREEGW